MLASPSTDPTFYLYYTATFPSFFAGLAINCTVLIALYKNRESLFQSRLDTLLSMLIVLFFLWCIAGVTRSLGDLFVDTDFFKSLTSLVTALGIMSIMWINVLIAMERYFSFLKWQDKCTFKFYAGVTACYLAAGTVAAFCSLASVCSDGIKPEASSPLRIVWLTAMSITIASSLLVAFALYVSTYLQATAMLSASFKQSMDESLLVQVERRILMSTIMMASTLLTFYVPIWWYIFLNIVPYKFELDQSIVNVWLFALSTLFLVLDTILSPLLVLYFMPRIRLAVVELIFPRQKVDAEAQVEEKLEIPCVDLEVPKRVFRVLDVKLGG
ncbi:hypothetical protein BC830DRAFT_1167549 [Chytriomyces sp. MP71]|nr:hypothetical protein BC830DRAFT_1167549 [Chytriomyces sp. MP71]